MNLKAFEYVLAVAEQKSFSKAAKKLFIAQPSLSQFIQQLEAQLGTELFDRTVSPVRLTYAGELYIAAARKILDLNRQLFQQISDVASERKGRIVVGISPYRSTYILPYVLPRFYALYPQVEVTLCEEPSTAINRMLLKGDLDLAVTTLPIEGDLVETIPMATEELFLAVPKAFFKTYDLRAVMPPGGNYPTIETEQLRNLPIIMLNTDQMLHQRMAELCRAHGFEPKPVIESRSIETSHALVMAGIGVTLVPASLVEFGNHRERPVYCTLSPDHPTRQLAASYRKDRYLSRFAKDFIRLMREQFAPYPNIP